MGAYAASRYPLSYEEMGLLDSDASSLDSIDESEADDKRETSRSTAALGRLLSVSPALGHVLSLIARFFGFLIPSFLQPPGAPRELSPTAYLDGIRGLAALFVYFNHYGYQAFFTAFGWGCGGQHYHLLKLPLLRLWYQGPPAVCVFFVISGYALSYRPLRLVRRRADFAAAISSLVFRCGIRLFLPTAVSTLMIVCLLRVGAYEWTRDFANDQTYMKVIVELHPPRLDSASAQLADWFWQMCDFVHVFGWESYGGNTTYDLHLWTIPVEFRCSLCLVPAIVATARLPPRLRLLFVGLVLCFAYRHSRWDLCLFLCGMLLADWDHIRGAHAPDRQPAARPLDVLCFLASVVGLYLMCQPIDKGDVTPGWRYLTSAIPGWWADEQYRYWQSVGAVVFVSAAAHSAAWQRFFNRPVVQYLGSISYALYLMHGPAMHTVGYHWEQWAYDLTGVDGPWYAAGFVLGACFAVPTVIWCADVFWRAVDVPTVKCARWFETKCIRDWGSLILGRAHRGALRCRRIIGPNRDLQLRHETSTHYNMHT